VRIYRPAPCLPPAATAVTTSAVPRATYRITLPPHSTIYLPPSAHAPHAHMRACDTITYDARLPRRYCRILPPIFSRAARKCHLAVAFGTFCPPVPVQHSRRTQPCARYTARTGCVPLFVTRLPALRVRLYAHARCIFTALATTMPSATHCPYRTHFTCPRQLPRTPAFTIHRLRFCRTVAQCCEQQAACIACSFISRPYLVNIAGPPVLRGSRAAGCDAFWTSFCMLLANI